jgi:acyl-coenzyme A thioesterase PaaI-like protein
MTFELWKQTWGMRLFAWWKIPLLAAARPIIEELNDDRCVVRIKLRRKTKNHLGSMYFGTLAIGADCAGGLIAVEQIRRKKAKVSLVFKSFQAQFLKRPESDVYFICEEGAKIRAQVDQTLACEDRVTEPVAITANVKLPDGTLEPVATFVLELSLKKSDRGVI